VVYSDHQRLELEKEFHYSRYITIRRKAELAATLNLSERQVGQPQSAKYIISDSALIHQADIDRCHVVSQPQ